MKLNCNCLLFFIPAILLSISFPESGISQWTRFRGFHGEGIDSLGSFPVRWDSTDFRWEIELRGTGNASPVVWEDTIFVTSADDENDLGFLLAADGREGKILWQREFNVTDISLHENNKLAAASPAVDESQVYIIWYSREKTTLTALTHNGTISWQAEFDGIESRHGGGSSLMMAGDNVIFTREQEEDSSLKSSWVAVNKQSGKTAWELERETAVANSFCTPLLIETGKGENQLIFASQAHGLTGVDPGTGRILWERKDLLPARVVASPLYSDGMIVVCRNGEALVVDMDPNTLQAADTARYTLTRNISPYVPTPIVVGEYLFLFMDNGTVACVRLATGELLWKERPAGAIFGSPVCVDGNLYCITKAGRVIVIHAGPEYQLSGIHDLGEGSFSTPVVCSPGIVFQTFSRLMMIGKE